MEQFKNKPDSFISFRKTLLINMLPVMLISLVGSVAISYFTSKEQEFDFISWLITAPFLLIALSVGLYVSLKRQKLLFESFTIHIDEQGITRIQHNTPTIHILKNDISEINKQKNGGFVIKGDSTLNMIGIPSAIENYERLESLLSEIKPISTTSNSLLVKYQPLISAATIGLMGAVYISTNKIIVAISGTLILALMAYSFFVTQKSKNIDTSTKKVMWVSLLMVGSVLAIMYYKLSA